MAAPAVRSHPDGALVAVRTAPGAARDGLAGLHGDALKVRVRAVPEKGKANAALCTVVARALRCAPREVTVVRGLRGRDKTLLVRGADPEELRATILEILGTLGGA